MSWRRTEAAPGWSGNMGAPLISRKSWRPSLIGGRVGSRLAVGHDHRGGGALLPGGAVAATQEAVGIVARCWQRTRAMTRAATTEQSYSLRQKRMTCGRLGRVSKVS
jgi:hypothetical protein